MNGDPGAVVRDRLLAAALAGAPAVERVEVARLDLAPLQESGLHRHPCPVVGVITAGKVRFQPQGEPERLLGPGDAFFEPEGTTILHFDNPSTIEVASFVAVYLLAPGGDRLIEML